MGRWWMLILGLVLKVAQCLETAGLETSLEISPNLTALLGEDVYLTCRYRGQSQVLSAEWKKRINSKSKAKRLAGFAYGKPFNRAGFTRPDSLTNLTVLMKVSSVDAEGEYNCDFQLEEEYIFDRLYITVVARPDIQLQVDAETINDTHYQTVSCSAVGGRPTPQISWLLGDGPPSDLSFFTSTSETFHPDGTSTFSSTLRLATHLLTEDSVTCLVRHPTLRNPTVTTVAVETYTRPNVTVEAEMLQEGENDFWVVSCLSSGGRPDTDISLALNTTLQRENDDDSDTQRVSVRLPATLYQGHDITCLFRHPKFQTIESRVFSLPTFSADLRSGNDTNDNPESEFAELQEEQSDVVIELKVTANVPRYNVTCRKDGGPLPRSVALVGSSLTFQAPVELHHAGLYECLAWYHHLKATLNLNVTVKAVVVPLVPPSIRVDLRSQDGGWMMECTAADAVPAANVSWRPAEGTSEASWFTSTSHNGSRSVRGVLLLPACPPSQLTAECVINHPTLREPEYRRVTLSPCAPPNVTVNISSEWKDGHKYTEMKCCANSGAPAADVAWHVGDAEQIISFLSDTHVHADGSLSTHSSVYFLSSLFAGQNLTCTVKHPSLETPERTTVHVPAQKAPVLSVRVVPQSSRWLAVCECSGEGVSRNLTWILPANAETSTSLHTESEGEVLKARLTYEFPLARHEGQNLTCEYQLGDGHTVSRNVLIPAYYISIRVLNRTSPLQNRYTAPTIQHRVALSEKRHVQKILLQVESNAPDYQLHCQRSDGRLVPMDGAAMVFEAAERDGGVYTCSASCYHHSASIHIEVEVTNQEEELMMLTLICISSSSAVLLILTVVLCVCCKRSRKTPRKESLSAFASMMQEPGSPLMKNPAPTKGEGKDCAQLLSYSIVIDVKSTV